MALGKGRGSLRLARIVSSVIAGATCLCGCRLELGLRSGRGLAPWLLQRIG